MPRADGSGSRTLGGDEVDQADSRVCANIRPCVAGVDLDSARGHPDVADLDQGSQDGLRSIRVFEGGQQLPRRERQRDFLRAGQVAHSAHHAPGPLAPPSNCLEVGTSRPAATRGTGEQTSKLHIAWYSNCNG